ncbi:TRAFAC clade GTPase domain-containing protein [Agrobacterium tumefaciens]|uniref:TRAFAC clade GTPase domain-containing protein n=1 Tax=Agrobacterium tumefaciens TaxID=358 RepID=UPI00165F4B5C|nr:ATP-binding protein [Agrobacterium tumefaciens]
MPNPTVAIVGLPGSGKTTFLAALWHIVNSTDGNPPALRIGSLAKGAPSYLNSIARMWRNATEQGRTQLDGNRLVQMNLIDIHERTVEVAFPDVAGEAYQQMWEVRDCDEDLEALLQAESVLLFINSDTIKPPRWINELNRQAKAMNLPKEEEGPAPGVKWDPKMAPTQVQLVDLLQLLRQYPLDVGPRKLVIGLSAWDKAEPEGLAPLGFLYAKLPLLAQYLQANADGWTWKVFGISAQGGQYRSNPASAVKRDADKKVLDLPEASDRIKIVADDMEMSRDITIPLLWLMGK